VEHVRRATRSSACLLLHALLDEVLAADSTAPDPTSKPWSRSSIPICIGPVRRQPAAQCAGVCAARGGPFRRGAVPTQLAPYQALELADQDL